MATISVLPTIGQTKTGYRVRYREDGELRAEEFATRDEARQRQKQLRAIANAPADPVQVAGDGTNSGDWLSLLWALAKKVAEGDVSAQRKLSVVAAAARSVQGHLDLAKIKAAQDEVKKMVREIRTHRKHGTRVSEGAGAAQVDAATREPIQ